MRLFPPNPRGRCLACNPLCRALMAVAGVVFLCLPMATHAGVRLKTSTAKPVVGVPFRIEIEVDGTGARQPAIDVENLQARYVGSSTSVRIGAGRRESTETFIYQAIARQEGTLVIPEIEVDVRSETVKTKGVMLKVVKQAVQAPQQGGGAQGGEPVKAAFVLVQPEREDIFVGELIEVQVKVYLSKQIGVLNLQREVALQGENLVFHASGAPVSTQETLNGNVYQVYTFRTALSAVKPGEIQIDPVGIEATVRMPKKKRAQRTRRSGSLLDRVFGDDPFMNDFMDVSFPERVTLSSGKATIKVLPLPKEGRPADFKGAIGDFALDVSADASEVQFDEALTVTASLTGQGNFERIQELQVDAGEAWRAYPAKSDFTAADRLRRSGEKRFKQVFIAQGQTTEGPGISFSYFDPEKKEYLHLTAPELAVAVAGVPSAAATAAQDAHPASSVTLSSLPGGLPPLIASSAGWQTTGQSSLPVTPGFLAANGAAAVMLTTLLVAGHMRRQRSDPARRRRRDYLSARQRLLGKLGGYATLGSAGFCGGVVELIEATALARYGERHTATDALGRMLEPENEDRGRLQAIVDHYESLRWSPNQEATPTEEDLDARKAGLSALERVATEAIAKGK